MQSLIQYTIITIYNLPNKYTIPQNTVNSIINNILSVCNTSESYAVEFNFDKFYGCDAIFDTLKLCGAEINSIILESYSMEFISITPEPYSTKINFITSESYSIEINMMFNFNGFYRYNTISTTPEPCNIEFNTTYNNHNIRLLFDDLTD